MRLELDIVNIKRVQLGRNTSVENGTLNVDAEELRQLLKEDPRISDVEIELANPGEKCRIAGVYDAVEPRARKQGSDFPGAVGPAGPVGEGNTCVLRGAAVLVSEYLWTGSTGAVRRRGDSFIDMWGPGAEYSIYGRTCNVIVMPRPNEGVSFLDYRVALKIAGMKTAAYLARAGFSQKPDSSEVYEIPALALAGDDTNLPRVVYILQIFSNQSEAVPGDPIFYGLNIDKMVPTIVHPNEVLDGALTVAQMDTYRVQNHAMVLELYRNHGKSLYFAGVIINNAPNNLPEIRRHAVVAANLAKWVLGADGVIATKCGGGAPEMTLGETGQRCEELGVKTVLAIRHAGIDTTESTMKTSTIFADCPLVDAMVSLGTNTAGGPEEVSLPAPERTIGTDNAELSREMKVPAGRLRSDFSQMGDSTTMAVRY